VPLKKYASVKDAVKGIGFFLKSGTSDSITGQNLVIDNGFTRKY
jgi:enoyl-[acyl-carrier-protein] reductase (NADH)